MMLKPYVVCCAIVFALMGYCYADDNHEHERTAFQANHLTDSRTTLVNFGVPFTDLPGPDLTKLPEQYQVLAQNIMRLDPKSRPPISMCFAQGTDPSIVEEFTKLLYYPAADPLSFQFSNRWTTTANGGTGSQGNPIILTYSFPPDGINIPNGVGEGARPNRLFARFNALFGSQAVWEAKFAQAFNQWGDLIGVTYQQVSDDNTTWGNDGLLGSRGDIRIGCKRIDGTNGILAYNSYPNDGEMVLDSAENWADSGNDYRFFRNTVIHENGHGLGMAHVCPVEGNKLMEPFLNESFDGPQHDEIRGGQRNYGDRFENNDNSGTATNLGALGNGTTTLTNLSSDDNGDVDYYQFTISSAKEITATLTPIGATYLDGPQNGDGSCSAGSNINSLDDQNMDLQLLDTNGSTVLFNANTQGAGVAETVPLTLLPAAGTYYLRMQNNTANNVVQIYNLGFTLSTPAGASITVLAPNGGESWVSGTNQNITWNSVSVPGNVMIEINRTYPSASWTTLFASITNDGTESWAVTGPATATARIRISSVSNPAIKDTSNSNFSVVVPSITITRPNGGEVLNGSTSESFTWTSANLTGNVQIYLNRSYPSLTWESLGVFGNTGSTSLILNGPISSNARARILSVSNPTVGDTSNTNFSIIYPGNPPTLVHDPRGDAAPGMVAFTAGSTDDYNTPSLKLFYRPVSGAYDSTNMTATGFGSEYAVTVNLPVAGAYEYYIRATDGFAYNSTAAYIFDVGGCVTPIIADDGTAEGFSWASETGYRCAVKFSPTTPFLLCGLQVAVARVSPDSAHSPILAEVYLANGVGGLPGTLIWSETTGSIGNAIGGLPNSLNWATVLIDSSSSMQPLGMTTPFYLAVSNPVFNKYEAFGRDTDTPNGGNSYFFDGCDSVWYNENDIVPNAQGGTRMIRAIGRSLVAPTQLVISVSGNDLVLNWENTGGPYYKVYSSTSTAGPFTTQVGSSTASTTLTDVNGVSSGVIKFYVVVASLNP